VIQILTILGVLPGNIGHGITDLIPHGAVRLGDQGLEELLSDSGGLVKTQGDEDLDCLIFIVLAALGRDASEDDGSKGSQLEVQQTSASVHRGAEGCRAYRGIGRGGDLLGQAHQ
jgi:hypothetical protein